MSYRVRLTETAKQDLREIVYYIADQAKDKVVARNFVNELRASCNRLTDFPQAGALPKDHALRSMDYRYITHKGYLILYIADELEKAVHILVIFNARKDDPRVMSRFV